MNVRLAALSMGILGLAGCATWQQFDGYLPARPPASVVDAGRVPGFERRFSSVELQRVDEFTGNGSLGMKNELIGAVRLQVGADGLTTEVSRLTWGHAADGKVRGVMDVQQLSVCGLLPLSRDIAGRAVIPDVVVSATPSTITTYSVDVERGSLERLVVDSLSGDLANLCAPQPGAQYSYQLGRQAQRRWSAAQNHRQPLAAQVKCRAAGAMMPASGVVPGLGGEALELRCTATYANEGDHVSRFMHVGALGIYLPLETSEPERGRTVYRYTKATVQVAPADLHRP